MKTDSNEHSCNENEIIFSECCDYVEKEINSTLSDAGILLSLKVNLKHVRCNSTIAVGVLVYDGKNLKSYKIKEIYTGWSCSKFNDIQTPKFYFVFKDVGTCLAQKYKVRVVANYICE